MKYNDEVLPGNPEGGSANESIYHAMRAISGGDKNAEAQATVALAKATMALAFETRTQNLISSIHLNLDSIANRVELDDASTKLIDERMGVPREYRN